MAKKIPIHHALIKNLLREFEKGDFYYVEKEKAYETLKLFTGEDFGYDAEAWMRFFEESVKKRFSSYEQYKHSKRRDDTET